MREGPEKDYFDDYHFCDKFHNLKVNIEIILKQSTKKIVNLN